jgi:hypothetical protein
MSAHQHERRRGARGLWLVLALAGAFAGCGDDGVGPGSPLVGGRCVVDRDCDRRCLTGGDFPGGYCSASCTRDDDCPRGAVCVDKQGGVCLLSCGHHDDCRALGPRYRCKAEDSRGVRNFKQPVCIGD